MKVWIEFPTFGLQLRRVQAALPREVSGGSWLSECLRHSTCRRLGRGRSQGFWDGDGGRRWVSRCRCNHPTNFCWNKSVCTFVWHVHGAMRAYQLIDLHRFAKPTKMVCNQHKLHSPQKGSCRNWANTRSNGLPFTVILTIEVGHSLGYRMVSPCLPHFETCW